MTILKRGSTGPEVVKLQKALAIANKAALTADGIFGGLTDAAVRKFQAAKWLVEDGVAGPCTQNALYGTEAYAPVLWSPKFIPQPTPTQCWAASTAMLTNTSVPVVLGRTPSDLIASDGGLKNDSDTDDAFTNAKRYAAANGIRLVSAASTPTLGYFKSLVSSGPLMLDMLWDANGYVKAIGSPGHMILVVGIRGDNDPTGKGTTLRIYDPWPPNRGKIYSVGFFSWMNEVTTRTYHMYQK